MCDCLSDFSTNSPTSGTKTFSIDNWCNITIEDLNIKLNQLQSKTNKTNRDVYWIAILKSQISAFDKYPCKYYPIIQKMI